LMETMRMIVTQVLVPKIGGGRMGLREWMIFPGDVREKLLDMEFDDWTNEITRMIPAYGQSMNKSATDAFESGLIEKRHYLALTAGESGG
jgi:defect-in-organelle-trafficking protein DotB